jgi:hypothetical protein
MSETIESYETIRSGVLALGERERGGGVSVCQVSYRDRQFRRRQILTLWRFEKLSCDPGVAEDVREAQPVSRQ